MTSMMESSSFQPNVRRTTMKMAPMSAVSAVFLLSCFTVDSFASQVCDQFAATNQSTSISLGYKLKDTDALKWKFGENTIFYQKSGQTFIGTSDDINPDGSRKLTNLKKDQTGLYTSEVYDDKGRKQMTKSTRLCIEDPVKKPQVKTTCKDESVEFKCELGQQPENTKYEWLKNGAKTFEKRLSFQVKVGDAKADKYACNVSNNAGFKTSEPVSHNCRTSGIPGIPDKLFGISIWVFIGGGGGIVLVLIIVVIVCCVQSKKRRKLRLQDEEELRLEWTNTDPHDHHLPPLPNHPPPSHHRNHHCHQQQQQQQQQAPGHTGPRQSRSKQNRQPRPRAPEPNGQPQPSPRRATQAQKLANDADEEQPPPLPQPRKKGPKTQVD